MSSDQGRGAAAIDGATTRGSVAVTQSGCMELSKVPSFGFNVLSFGDMQYQSSDVQGRLAVGGNATLTDFSVGDQLGPDQSRVDLVVGGNLTFLRGSVGNGGTVYGGTLSATNVVFYVAAHPQAAFFDFSGALASSVALSNQLAALTANGTVNASATGTTTTLQLTGSNAALNVFDLTSSDVATAGVISLATPPGATVVVNISGATATFSSLLMDETGATAANVLLNFPDATVLDMTKIAVQGSVLAPNAGVQFTSGQLVGSLVAGSLGGTGQVNYQPFTGCIPLTPTPTPIPTPIPTPVPTPTPGPNYGKGGYGPTQSPTQSPVQAPKSKSSCGK